MPRMQVRRCRLVARNADTMLHTYIHLGLDGAPDATSSPSSGKLHTIHTIFDTVQHSDPSGGVQGKGLHEHMLLAHLSSTLPHLHL